MAAAAASSRLKSAAGIERDSLLVPWILCWRAVVLLRSRVLAFARRRLIPQYYYLFFHLFAVFDLVLLAIQAHEPL
jgi:hypothetical protein